MLARKTLDSDLMFKPPLHMKLWAWMLLRANHGEYNGIRRGEFLTSIDGMRSAMSYKVGYRIMKPTKKEIRLAYESFLKSNQVRSRRTTRGMIITLVNYDFYNDPANYKDPFLRSPHEGHTKGITKGTMKGITQEPLNIDTETITDESQDYEGHHEGEHEGHTKGTEGAHDIQQYKTIKNKRKNVSGEPDPRVTEFKKWWNEKFHELTDVDYPFEHAKDGAMIKRMLSVYEFNVLKDMISDFFQSLDRDSQYADVKTLGMFYKQLPVLAVRRSRRPGVKTESYEEAKKRIERR